MTASRNRRILIIGVLAALFALGVGGLAYLATGASGGPARGSNVADDGPPSSLVPSDGSSPGTAGAPGADGPGGGDDDTAPPKPRRDVPTTGINLDGNGDATCFAVLPFTEGDNAVQVPLRVAAVEVTSTNDVIVGNSGGCSTCVGARIGAGGAPSCQVGVRLGGRKPYPANVSVTVTLTMHTTCTDASLKPCGVAAGSSPSNPVTIEVTGRHTQDIPVPDAGGPDSPPVESPAPPDTSDPATPPDTGEAPSTPGTQSVPEREGSS